MADEDFTAADVRNSPVQSESKLMLDDLVKEDVNGKKAVDGGGNVDFDAQEAKKPRHDEKSSVTGQETDRDEKTPLDSAEQEKKTTLSRKMVVPNNKVGDLIGKAGVTIKYLQISSGAKIQIKSDPEADPRAPTRRVELIGSLESIEKAEKLINDIISEFDAEGALAQLAAIAKQLQMYLPTDKDKELNENDRKMVSKLAQLEAIAKQFQMYLPTDKDKELNENDLKMVCKLARTAVHLNARLLEASVDLPNKVIVEGLNADQICEQVDMQFQVILPLLHREVERLERNPDQIAKFFVDRVKEKNHIKDDGEEKDHNTDDGEEKDHITDDGEEKEDSVEQKKDPDVAL